MIKLACAVLMLLAPLALMSATDVAHSYAVVADPGPNRAAEPIADRRPPARMATGLYKPARSDRANRDAMLPSQAPVVLLKFLAVSTAVVDLLAVI